MAKRKALRDEAADRSRERYPNSEDWHRDWAYRAAYEAVVKRFRQAVYRGAVSPGDPVARMFWEEVVKIGKEKLEELEKGESQ